MKNFLTVSIRSFIAITFCFVVLCQNPAIAQIQNNNDRTGVLHSKMFDARTLSMSNSTIADVSVMPDIGINAALLGLVNQPSVIKFNSNHNWENNLMQHSLRLPNLNYGPHHITTRFGFLHQGFDNLPFTSSSTLSTPDVLRYQGEIAYAITFSEYFSIGTLQSISFTSTTNGRAKYRSYVADIGLVYSPTGPVSYGMVFRGLGHETNFEVIENEQTRLEGRLATQVLEVGATIRYPIEDRTYLSISFANEKRFGQDGLWYKGGLEITPFSFIEIRAGGRVNFNRSHFIPRVGLGVNTGMLQINYMIAPKKIFGEQFHQIGLTIQL